MPRQIIHVGRKIRVALDTWTDEEGRNLERDVILHPGAVAIIPLIGADEVVLVRNERPVVGETLWEIPAGTLEPGEAPENAAIRELAEETGYRAAQWTKLTAFYPSPGVMNEITHLFVARELTPGPMELEADETIEPHVVPMRQALEWIRTGTIRDAKTILALLLLRSLNFPG